MEVLNAAYTEQVLYIYQDTTVISVIVLEYYHNVLFSPQFIKGEQGLVIPRSLPLGRVGTHG